jgi:hypothetical protein
MFEGTHEVANREKLKASLNINVMSLTWGVAENFNATIAVPYKHIEAGANPEHTQIGIENRGIGDIVLISSYRLSSNECRDFKAALRFGVKLPTGSTNDTFKQGAPGVSDIYAPLPTQMGTGAPEFKLGGGITKLFHRARLDTDLMLTYRTEAKHGHDFGHELNYTAAYIQNLTPKINIGMEYNLKYNTETSMGEDTTPRLRQALPFKAFSGSAGYLTPQIQFLPFGNPRLHLDVGHSILIHYNLNEYQPLEKTRVLVRIGCVF